jgi:hypothetical protein
MVPASDGEAWTHFDGIRHEKAKESHNEHVVLATNGFNPYGMMVAPYTCWPVFVIPLNLPPRRMLSTIERILIVDNFWTPGE